MAKQKKLKGFSFGGSKVAKLSPDSPGLPPVLNVYVSFDEALKLSVALQAALMDLNRLNMSTKAGKKASVNLSVKTKLKRVDVVRG